MKPIKSFLGSLVGTAMSYGFALGIVALVLSMAADEFPVIRDGADHLRCLAGVPAEGSACVDRRMEALAAEKSAIETEKAAVEAQLREAETWLQEAEALNAANEARRAELEAISARVSNFSLFEKADSAIGFVSTGVRFASVLEPELWEEAWCYIFRNAPNGAEIQISLGNQAYGEAVEFEAPSQRVLDEVGLTRAQIDAARASCRFPETF